MVATIWQMVAENPGEEATMADDGDHLQRSSLVNAIGTEEEN